MTIEERLKEFAHKIGIDLIGITTVEPFLEARQRLEKMRELGYLSPWAEPDFERRCDPRRLMADAQSLIAVGLVYPLPDKGEHKNGTDRERKWCGQLARFAQYQDYHSLLRTKLEEVVSWLRQEYPQMQAQIYVDTGPLLEREVAYRAGLGFIGKNAALIHPEYGSFLALGEILTDLSLHPDQPLENGCGECTLCLEACPQRAITSSGEINARQCLAHYTQEKGVLADSVKEKLGVRLWGCDTCQDVCPYNRKAGEKCQETAHHWVQHGLGICPDLVQVTQLTNRDYQECVGSSAMAWRGKTTLQRNALINLGNLRDPETIAVLKDALKDPRPVIRATSVWALGRMRSKEVVTLLRQELGREKDPQVRKALEDALQQVEKDQQDSGV